MSFCKMAEAVSVVKGVAALQDELERTKDRLRGVDETIKKLTGRDPSENRLGQRRIVRTPDISRGIELGRGRERIFALARYGVDSDRGPPAKRQVIQSAFGRLGPQMGFNRPGMRRDRDSGDEDDLPRKVTLHSSVVVTPKETRTRTDTLAAQNKDATGKARNRRMFGLLLGTLQRFRDDEKLKVEKEEKRKAVEQKVEERAKQDKENLRRERQNLFNKRKAEQARMRTIQHKMELAEIHEEWEMQTKQLMKFIRTKTSPHIFYLPKIVSAATDNKLKETHDTLQAIISERRRQLEEEIDEVTCHDAGAMEADDTNHPSNEESVKTGDTRQGQMGATGGGHDDGVDKVEKDSDNETRSSSDEGEFQGVGVQGDEPHGKWENSNGDGVGGDGERTDLHRGAGKQGNMQESSSDSESEEGEKHVVRDEESKYKDSNDKEKEEMDKKDSHSDKEEGHGHKEDRHSDQDDGQGKKEDVHGDQEDRFEDKEEKNRDKKDKIREKEDKHGDKEERHKRRDDRHRDKEDRHRDKEDRHRDKEVKHRDKEDRHREKDDKHRDREDKQRDKDDKHRDKDRHRDTEDKHRDKDGSHRHHSHRSSRDNRKVKEQSPHPKKRAHSEDDNDSDETHDRRKRSESLPEKTKAPKAASQESGQVCDQDDDVAKKEGDGDLMEVGGDKGEGRTLASKEEAMED